MYRVLTCSNENSWSLHVAIPPHMWKVTNRLYRDHSPSCPYVNSIQFALQNSPNLNMEHIEGLVGETSNKQRHMITVT